MSEEENIENQNAENQKPEVESQLANNVGFEEDSTKEGQHSVEENDAVAKPSTINDQPSTTMEVHKHPHHVTHKKKWGEYLLEFLMIFLAVFLGFVAENIRENSVEQHREKQFIRSLMNDIKADTARMKYIITQRTIREQRLDSLTFLLNSDSNSAHTNIIYFYAVTASRSLAFRFIPTDGTMQQLKNSGAFRLIRNREVADSIGRYDVSVRNFQRQGELEEIFIQDYRVASASIFDALVFDRMLDTNNNVSMPVENPGLPAYDKRDLHAWNYKMYSIKAINRANRRDARLLLEQGENLLETLKKEYDLD